MKFAVAFLTGAMLFCASSLSAQTQPGPEHAFLAELEGTWEVKSSTPGGDMTGTATYKMKHGGLWLVSEMDAKMPEGPFTGQGLDTYDTSKKKYVSIWVDSMSSSPVTLEGDRSKDGKTLTMTGKGPGMDGNVTDFKTVTEVVSKDKHVFKMWMGDTQGDPVMTIHYTRKK